MTALCGMGTAVFMPDSVLAPFDAIQHERRFAVINAIKPLDWLLAPAGGRGFFRFMGRLAAQQPRLVCRSSRGCLGNSIVNLAAKAVDISLTKRFQPARPISGVRVKPCLRSFFLRDGCGAGIRALPVHLDSSCGDLAPPFRNVLSLILGALRAFTGAAGRLFSFRSLYCLISSAAPPKSLQTVEYIT